MGKIIKFGKEAHSLVLKGVTELEETVISTLGPKGGTVIIDNGTGHPICTKDGITVARSISFSDKYKNIGASLLKDASARTNKEAGDGTTTTVLLTAELIKAGIDLINLGVESSDIKVAFNQAKDDIINSVSDYVAYIENADDIEHVATISANNDNEIGKVIREAFEGIGDDGTISILDSFNGKTSVKFKQGYELNSGYYSSLYANTKEGTYENKDVRVLLSKDPIDSLEMITPVLEYATQTKNPIAIVTPFVGDDVNGILLENVKNKILDCVVIPAQGSSKQAIENSLEDLAILLDQKVFSKTDKDLFQPKTFLGKIGLLKVSKRSSSFIDPPEGNEEKIVEYTEALKAKLEEVLDSEESAMTEFEIGTVKERVARLTGGIATIYVGANSEIEMKEKKDRYEDAINAVRASLDKGILAGGGSTLAKIVYKLEKFNKNKSKFNPRAYSAFLNVCKIPCRKILESASISNSGLTYEKIASNKNKYLGFNAKKEVISKNMIKDGIIDPALVIMTALKYATSVASTFVSANAVIVDEITNTTFNPNDMVMTEY